MFISFSKTIARFGGFRLGVGMRVNKKNAIWMSFLVMFIAMFKAMWYMMILCGWLFYAVCYGMYWCIKKIIGTVSKNQKISHKQATYSEAPQDLKPQDTNIEERDDTPIMTTSHDNNQNNNSDNKSSNKKSAIVRWIVGGFFAMFALVNGFHFSSLFLLLSAFLMFPLPFVENFLKKINVKNVIAIILSVALFFVGMITSPLSESTEDPSNDTNQSQTDNNNNDQNSENTNNSQSGNGNTENNTNDSNDNNNSNDNNDENNATTIKLLSPTNYNGPECWLFNETDTLIEVYAKIETTDSNWKASCKTVFLMLIEEFQISTDNSNTLHVTLKIYNSKDNMSNNQPDYSNLIALWQSHPSLYLETDPQITYYPNGAGINAEQEVEFWPTDNTTSNDENVKMVWVASSGTKYHSKSTCSNMTSPRQISLEDAQEAGYTACKKCH